MLIVLFDVFDKLMQNERAGEPPQVWREAIGEVIVFDVPILIALFVMWKSVVSLPKIKLRP
jgi:hypothetical protein